LFNKACQFRFDPLKICICTVLYKVKLNIRDLRLESHYSSPTYIEPENRNETIDRGKIGRKEALE